MGDQTTTASHSLLMASLVPEDRAGLLALGKPVSFRAREMIYALAEPGDTMIYIETGRVEISVTSQAGRKSVLNHMGPGEVLGEIALLDGDVRSADAVATEPVTGRVFHRRDVLDFMRARPDAMLGLISELCSKIRNASDMFEVQSQLEASTRLARCLLRLSAKWGTQQEDGSTELHPGFSQTDLGDFAGLTRESVNRHLKKWGDAGVVAIEAGVISITDTEALSDLAQL